MVELNRRSFVSSQDDMIYPLVLIICSDSWIFYLLIYASLCLCHGSSAPFCRPSASLENCSTLPLCLSLFNVSSLIPPHYTCCISACCCPKYNSRRRSLFMRALSHSDTHHLNRYMAWCGCHEILIALA